jgi:protein-tyrosine phosphatase
MGKIMDNAYMQIMIDANTALIGDLFRRLADPDQLPALIHCTAGKDRTGIASALLLLTLGVPEEVVIADYSLSNRYYDHFKKITEKTVAPLTRFGITTEDLRPLLSADPNRLRATFAYIEQRYGSLHNYLRRAAGIDDATLDALKENLLE